MAGDDTAVGFLKHPIDGGTEKLLLYSTLGDLVLKSKSLSLGTEAMATMDCDVLSISNTEMVSNFELSLTTSSKSKWVSVNKSIKKLSSKQSPNHCHICKLKYGSDLDNDYSLLWIVH